MKMHIFEAIKEFQFRIQINHVNDGNMFLVPTVVQWDSHRELVHGQE